MNKDLRKAAEMALEALSKVMLTSDKGVACENARKVLRQALAQPVDAVNMSQERVDETAKGEHEPFIYVREDNERPFGGYEHCSEADAGAFPVYTAPMIYTPPPKREWVGLTHEERDEIDQTCRSQMEALFSIEAKLKEKNT
jgi:hypothetical protein